MKGTSTRPPRPGSYGAYVSGGNALQIDYDELEAPRRNAPDRHGLDREAPQRSGSRRAAPGRITPGTNQPAPRPGRAAKRQPWVSDVTGTETAPLPITLPRTPFLVLVLGLVVVGVLGVLVLNTKINENSFRLNDLQATQAALDLQEQQLAQNLADLESPGNLRAAATRLGLVPAGTPAFINLPDGRIVGVPQPASGR